MKQTSSLFHRSFVKIRILLMTLEIIFWWDYSNPLFPKYEGYLVLNSKWFRLHFYCLSFKCKLEWRIYFQHNNKYFQVGFMNDTHIQTNPKFCIDLNSHHWKKCFYHHTLNPIRLKFHRHKSECIKNYSGNSRFDKLNIFHTPHKPNTFHAHME